MGVELSHSEHHLHLIIIHSEELDSRLAEYRKVMTLLPALIRFSVAYRSDLQDPVSPNLINCLRCQCVTETEKQKGIKLRQAGTLASNTWCFYWYKSLKRDTHILTSTAHIQQQVLFLLLLLFIEEWFLFVCLFVCPFVRIIFKASTWNFWKRYEKVFFFF